MVIGMTLLKVPTSVLLKRLRFRLIIDINLIGGIGGTESPDNNPVKGGEYIEWKWKLDFGDRVQYDFEDNESGGVIVINSV